MHASPMAVGPITRIRLWRPASSSNQSAAPCDSPKYTIEWYCPGSWMTRPAKDGEASPTGGSALPILVAPSNYYCNSPGSDIGCRPVKFKAMLVTLLKGTLFSESERHRAGFPSMMAEQAQTTPLLQEAKRN